MSTIDELYSILNHCELEFVTSPRVLMKHVFSTTLRFMKDHRMNMEDITGLDIDKILESEYMNGKYTYRSRNPSNHSSPEANGAIEDLFELDEAA